MNLVGLHRFYFFDFRRLQNLKNLCPKLEKKTYIFNVFLLVFGEMFFIVQIDK